MDNVLLDKNKVEDLFKKHNHQADVLLDLYKMVFPDWDNIKSIDGWPKINHNTWLNICSMFTRFDNKHSDSTKVMPGGLWMNKGFAGQDKYEVQLKDWEVSFENVELEY